LLGTSSRQQQHQNEDYVEGLCSCFARTRIIHFWVPSTATTWCRQHLIHVYCFESKGTNKVFVFAMVLPWKPFLCFDKEFFTFLGITLWFFKLHITVRLIFACCSDSSTQYMGRMYQDWQDSSTSLPIMD
jgi:hypothetical protein